MPTSWTCLDASVVIRLVSNPSDVALKQQFQVWQSNSQLAAPTLLFYELTNALYQQQRHGYLSPVAVKSALQTAQALPIQLYGDALLHPQALNLANQYSLPATYDAHYLALAQSLGAELWTTDKKLVNTIKEKLKWVQLWT